jgi:hypothetical protein
VVHLFVENGDKKDKFKTKAADPNSSGAYLVRGMAFSPDSTKLAIAQSDNIVFVYRCAQLTVCCLLTLSASAKAAAFRVYGKTSPRPTIR